MKAAIPFAQHSQKRPTRSERSINGAQRRESCSGQTVRERQRCFQLPLKGSTNLKIWPTGKDSCSASSHSSRALDWDTQHEAARPTLSSSSPTSAPRKKIRPHIVCRQQNVKLQREMHWLNFAPSRSRLSRKIVICVWRLIRHVGREWDHWMTAFFCLLTQFKRRAQRNLFPQERNEVYQGPGCALRYSSIALTRLALPVLFYVIPHTPPSLLTGASFSNYYIGARAIEQVPWFRQYEASTGNISWVMCSEYNPGCRLRGVLPVTDVFPHGKVPSQQASADPCL